MVLMCLLASEVGLVAIVNSLSLSSFLDKLDNYWPALIFSVYSVTATFGRLYFWTCQSSQIGKCTIYQMVCVYSLESSLVETRWI